MNKKTLCDDNTLLVILFLHVLLVPNKISFIVWIISICWCVFLLLFIPFFSQKIDTFKFKKELNLGVTIIIGLFMSLTVTVLINIFFVVFDYILIQKIFLYIFLSLITVYIMYTHSNSLNYHRIMKMFSYMVLVLGSIRYFTHEFFAFLVYKDILDFPSWTFWQDVGGRLIILILCIVVFKNIFLVYRRLRERF